MIPNMDGFCSAELFLPASSLIASDRKLFHEEIMVHLGTLNFLKEKNPLEPHIPYGLGPTSFFVYDHMN